MSRCRSCDAAKSRGYYAENRAKKRAYYQANRERIIARVQERRRGKDVRDE